ncbi:MAG: cell division protein FtsA [Flavobacteriales bacterium]
MNNDIIVGLDIGTTKIACLVGRLTENNKMEILGVGRSESVGVQRGVVTNIEQTVNSIRMAVEQAERESGVNIKTVNVGIAGQHIRSVQQRGMYMCNRVADEITREDVSQLISDMHKVHLLPGEKIIHALPQEFSVDGENGIKNPVGMSGIRMEANFHVITGQITAIGNIYKCVQRAGLEVKELMLEPLASSAAVLSDEEKEAGVALVDIGGGTTDVAIFQDGIIRHTTVIPFGGNIITEDIRTGCTIMKNEAEALKTQYGSALATEAESAIICIKGLRGRATREISTKVLADIIQARMSEILELVHYEIRNSGYEKKLIGGIVLTGGGSQLKHMKQLVEYTTGLDCRIGYPNEHVSKAPSEKLLIPALATGVGLVISGAENVERSTENRQVEEVAVTPVAADQDPRNPKGILGILRDFFETKDEEA